MHKIASKPENICEIESLVNHWADQYQLPQDVKCNLLVSLTEAVNNAIIHGNRNDASKFVHIEHFKDGSQLRVVIEDEGKGFNIENLPDPRAPDQIDCCGGRGVFLIRELCDALEFKKNGARLEICFQIQ